MDSSEAFCVVCREQLVRSIYAIVDPIDACSPEPMKRGSAKSLALGEEGHEVRAAGDGLAALEVLRGWPADLLVTDVNMPRLDGFALCRRLRGAGVDVPIVMLTSRDGEVDEALGLELGADDWVTKPFSTRVLFARIGALLRRRGGGAGEAEDVVRAGRLSIDRRRMLVRWGEAPIEVTRTELRLLEALARRPGVVLARERLLELARDDDSVVGDRVVDTYVRRLRRKIEAVDPTFSAIETVIGSGYRDRKSVV